MKVIEPPSPVLLADPDSSPGPFEGPEKLLEIWFAPSSDLLPDVPESSLSASLRFRASQIKTGGGSHKGLRKVPREVWEEMLDIVKCKVLSVVEGEELDAYLLRWVRFQFGFQREATDLKNCLASRHCLSHLIS